MLTSFHACSSIQSATAESAGGSSQIAVWRMRRRLIRNVGVDLYNLLNSSAVLNYNTAFNPGGTWLTPTSVVAPRFAKFSASVEF